MARVLIPSDNTDFVVHYVKAYAEAGHDVVVGAFNFFAHGGRFDFVHFLWPEEFSSWRPPDERALKRIRESLDRWTSTTQTVVTVNNLYPHGYEGDARYQRLYELFYERCGAIVHHSSVSRDLVLRHFPTAVGKLHAVATHINYFDLVRDGADRKKLRAELGLAESEFVPLIFGTIRKWPEAELLIQAISRARIPGKRPLVVARYSELSPMNIWRNRWLRFRWALWLKRSRAVAVNQYVPDEELYRYLESADVVVVPRLTDLSSGLIGMGLTFGKLIVAPNHGAFPDYLAGTENLLYQSGDAASLAAALEKAASLDRERIGRRNRELAASWTWANIVQTCLKAGAESRNFKSPAHG